MSCYARCDMGWVEYIEDDAVTVGGVGKLGVARKLYRTGVPRRVG